MLPFLLFLWRVDLVARRLSPGLQSPEIGKFPEDLEGTDTTGL